MEVDRVADFLRQTKGLFHRGERLLRMTGLRKFDPEVLHRGSPHLERADPRGHLDRTPEVRIRLLRVATPPVELSEHPQGPCELRGLAERLESRQRPFSAFQGFLVTTSLVQEQHQPGPGPSCTQVVTGLVEQRERLPASPLRLLRGCSSP